MVKTVLKTLPYIILFSIVRALERIGKVYLKQDKLEEALEYFEKSLTECRSDDVLKKVNKVC